MRPGALAVALAALMNAGCLVASLHPIYEQGSIRFDPALVGAWEDEDGQSSMVVEAGPWRSYRATVKVQSASTAVIAYEMRIGEVRILDMTVEHGLESSPILVPTHAIARLSVAGDRMELRPLDYEWFRKMLEQRALTGLAGSLDERENVLITSPAAQLRTWIAAQLTADGVFSAPMRFLRRTAGPQP